jgi:hypothetical protein
MLTRALTATSLAVLSLAPQAPQADPKKQVMTVVEDSIALITEKKHVEMFKKYLWPAELERLIAKFGTVEAAAEAMVKTERMAILLKVLQTAAKLEPSFEQGGTIARFRFDAPIGRDAGLKLEKAGGRWYLRD